MQLITSPDNFIARRNLHFRIGNIKDLTSESMESVTAAEWENCVRHVLGFDRQYWQIDIAVDEVPEPVALCLGKTKQTFDVRGTSD